MPLGLGLWFLRRMHPFLKPRNFELLCIAGAGLSLAAIVPGLTNFVDRDKFPCDFILVSTFMLLPIGVGPLVVRLMLFKGKGNWQQLIRDLSSDELASDVFETGSFFGQFGDFVRFRWRSLFGTRERTSSHAVKALGPGEVVEGRSSNAAADRAHFFSQSPAYGLLLQLALTILSIVLLVASIQEEGSPYGGKVVMDAKSIMHLSQLFSSLLLPYSRYVLPCCLPSAEGPILLG